MEDAAWLEWLEQRWTYKVRVKEAGKDWEVREIPASESVMSLELWSFFSQRALDGDDDDPGADLYDLQSGK